MGSLSCRALLTSAVVAGTLALASGSAWAVKVGPVEDPVRVVKVPKGQPIVMALYTVLSGPDAGQGLDPYRGAQLAVDDLKGKLLDRPLRLTAEDDACSAEGGQTAATKIAANQQVVIALGSNCSSATIPAAPILWKAGIPDIATGAASPKLTDVKARGPGYEGFSRVIYNAAFEGEALAEWARNTKKLDKVAAVHDGTPYVQGLVEAFTNKFKSLGGTVVTVEAINAQDVDMRPMLTRLVTTKPQMVFFPTFIAATAHIVKQAKEVDGFKDIMMMGSDNVLDKNFINLAGQSSVGFTIVSPPLDADSYGDAYKKLLEQYKKKFGEGPTTAWTAHGYDAVMLAAKSIEKVAVKDKDGTIYIPISKLQEAILATKDMKGVSGTITCRPNGDCAQFRAVFYQYVNADPNTFDIGKNPKNVNP
ncbi:MAG: branched-chain amino acid ABC transporter substrate-binding protein [Alphaproteobacteria bacterium]